MGVRVRMRLRAAAGMFCVRRRIGRATGLSKRGVSHPHGICLAATARAWLLVAGCTRQGRGGGGVQAHGEQAEGEMG